VVGPVEPRHLDVDRFGRRCPDLYDLSDPAVVSVLLEELLFRAVFTWWLKRWVLVVDVYHVILGEGVFVNYIQSAEGQFLSL